MGFINVSGFDQKSIAIKEYIHACNTTSDNYFIFNECEFHHLVQTLILIYSTIIIVLILILAVIQK